MNCGSQNLFIVRSPGSFLNFRGVTFFKLKMESKEPDLNWCSAHKPKKAFSPLTRRHIPFSLSHAHPHAHAHAHTCTHTHINTLTRINKHARTHTHAHSDTETMPQSML